jgi:hypothetical protein
MERTSSPAQVIVITGRRVSARHTESGSLAGDHGRGRTAKNRKQTGPKHDKSTEAVFKGPVHEVGDRQCPVSGGLGSQLMLKEADGSLIEAHLALTKFVTPYELVFHKGDVLEVTGVKVKFQGVDTIFARKIKRGDHEFLVRDHDGKPLW